MTDACWALISAFASGPSLARLSRVCRETAWLTLAIRTVERLEWIEDERVAQEMERELEEERVHQEWYNRFSISEGFSDSD